MTPFAPSARPHTYSIPNSIIRHSIVTLSGRNHAARPHLWFHLTPLAPVPDEVPLNLAAAAAAASALGGTRAGRRPRRGARHARNEGPGAVQAMQAPMNLAGRFVASLAIQYPATPRR